MCVTGARGSCDERTRIPGSYGELGGGGRYLAANAGNHQRFDSFLQNTYEILAVVNPRIWDLIRNA